MPTPAISVCIVGSRRDPLDACLASLLAQEAVPDFELLVSIDRDPAMAAAVRERFPQARVCHGDGLLPGAARNDLVERATGELLLFIDDDVTTHRRLLRNIVELAAEHPEATVFGGPNETPRASSRFQFLQGAVLASLAGSGPVRRRYGSHHEGPADERWFILCNLAVRREAMLRFPEDLVCAEENAVLSTLREGGAEMHYNPKLVVFHERRATPWSFATQMTKYGRGRGELMARTPTTARVAYLAPAALLLYLLSLPVSLALVGLTALVPALLYAAFVLAGSVAIASTLRKVRAAAPAAALTVLLHVCYGAGLLRGLLLRGPPRSRPASRWEEDHVAAVAGEQR